MMYKWVKDRNIEHEAVGEGLHRAMRHFRDEWVGAGVREPVCYDLILRSRDVSGFSGG